MKFDNSSSSLRLKNDTHNIGGTKLQNVEIGNAPLFWFEQFFRRLYIPFWLGANILAFIGLLIQLPGRFGPKCKKTLPQSTMEIAISSQHPTPSTKLIWMRRVRFSDFDFQIPFAAH